MHVSHLKIENWKNFKSGDVKLGERLFLIGPNASGKSNFLDVFRFLRDLSVSGGGLHQAVDVHRGGVSAIRCLYARQPSNVVVDVEIKDDNDIWKYHLSFGQDNNRRPRVIEERVDFNGSNILLRPNVEDQKDSFLLTETALEQTSTNQNFRPVVQFFQSISYQHLLPQVIRDPQGFSPNRVSNDPFGRDFLQRIDNTQQRAKDSRLRKIQRALQVAVPQLDEMKIERDTYGVPHLIGVYKHWRPGAGKQNESQFSDGTLRLFGLLWTLFEGNGPLLMEEPELSLHNEIARYLPQLIRSVTKERKISRQVIISTHSEEILSDKGIGGEEVLRLEPTPEGTLLKSPAQDPETRGLLESGLSIAEVVLPQSAPKGMAQMVLAMDK